MTKRSINTILPQEILSRIFYFGVTNYVDDLDYPSRQLKRLFRVCRYWRNVLLTSPIVFSCINILPGRRKWLAECLHYSRQAALDVHYHCTRLDLDPDMWALVVPHLSHTRSLSIAADIRDLPVFPWPRSTVLTSLSFKHSYSRPGHTELSPFPIIDGILSALPNLLELYSDTSVLGPHWTERPLPTTLKSMSIEHHPSEPKSDSKSESLSNLLFATRKLTSLNRLTLKGLGANHYLPPPSPLRHIRPLRLCLAGHMYACAHILASVVVVETLNLSVHGINRKGREGANLDALMGSLSKIIGYHHNPHTVFLQISANHRSWAASIGFHAVPSAAGAVLSRRELHQYVHRLKPIEFDHFKYNISFDLPQEYYRHQGTSEHTDRVMLVQNFFGKLMSLFPQINTLIGVFTIPTDECLIMHAWDTIVSHSANVQTLQLVFNNESRFVTHCPDSISILNLPATLLCESSEGGRDEKTGYPYLRSLDLWLETDSAEDPIAQVVGNIVEVLEERKRRGYSLKKLSWHFPVRMEGQFRERLHDLVEDASS
ncbi:hypothetical protein QCA50_007057 [Cerrena zonata]|uniref:F-box domain-containing protein n=1 Tax=Cerrena zonata TaxID=2478898 RepID=A0AAW0GL93_9APHY